MSSWKHRGTVYLQPHVKWFVVFIYQVTSLKQTKKAFQPPYSTLRRDTESPFSRSELCSCCDCDASCVDGRQSSINHILFIERKNHIPRHFKALLAIKGETERSQQSPREAAVAGKKPRAEPDSGGGDHLLWPVGTSRKRSLNYATNKTLVFRGHRVRWECGESSTHTLASGNVAREICSESTAETGVSDSPRLPSNYALTLRICLESTKLKIAPSVWAQPADTHNWAIQTKRTRLGFAFYVVTKSEGTSAKMWALANSLACNINVQFLWRRDHSLHANIP